MRVAVGADHGGFPLKGEILVVLREAGHEPLDLGAHAYNAADDYPDFASAVAQAVAGGQADRGILICGSGVGASVAANKFHGIRAGLCHDTYSAHQGVEHDDMNVLCLGARIIGSALARELVEAFLSARFSGEERHQRRLNRVLSFENAP
ncbi:MAG: ribose 5-phosphate isomerase B [Acidobacteria bacterium]|nr:ribose 5-phosphate isomerase B [Acidobacteriota bacterium]